MTWYRPERETERGSEKKNKRNGWNKEDKKRPPTILTRWDHERSLPCTFKKSFKHSPMTYSVMIEGIFPSRQSPRTATIFLCRCRLNQIVRNKHISNNKKWKGKNR